MEILVRSGVIITLILLSLAFLYVFVNNWKVYEISLLGKGQREPERSSNMLLLGNNLVSTVVAPITTKSSPQTITINVLAPEDQTIHHGDSGNVTQSISV